MNKIARIGSIFYTFPLLINVSGKKAITMLLFYTLAHLVLSYYSNNRAVLPRIILASAKLRFF